MTRGFGLKEAMERQAPQLRCPYSKEWICRPPFSDMILEIEEQYQDGMTAFERFAVEAANRHVCTMCKLSGVAAALYSKQRSR